MRAAAMNLPAVIEFLIQNNAEVNAADGTGWTPLHHAAAMDAKEACQLLVRRGGSTLSRDQYGKTPLDIAVSAKGGRVFEYLSVERETSPTHCSSAVPQTAHVSAPPPANSSGGLFASFRSSPQSKSSPNLLGATRDDVPSISISHDVVDVPIDAPPTQTPKKKLKETTIMSKLMRDLSHLKQ